MIGIRIRDCVRDGCVFCERFNPDDWVGDNNSRIYFLEHILHSGMNGFLCEECHNDPDIRQIVEELDR